MNTFWTYPVNFFLQAQAPIDEEFNLFLFAIVVSGIIFMCISVIIAILIAIIFLLIIFGFVATGALSTSIIVGINKKSFTSGFRTFVIVFSTFAFAIIGIGSFWFLNKIVHWWTEIKAISIGLSIGLVSGITTGLLLAFVIKKISTLFKNKLERLRGIS